MKHYLLLLVCALLVGCNVYKQQPKVEITHVLAVTSEGDTLRLPISMIKPNVYYNITHYPHRYYNLPYNWHHSNWQYNTAPRPIYIPRGGSGNINNNNSNNNPPNTGGSKPAPAVITPPSKPTPPPNRGGRN